LNAIAVKGKGKWVWKTDVACGAQTLLWSMTATLELNANI